MNPHAMKLLQALGGMASESYGQGASMTGQQRKGGQPMLPKPAISRPDMLSPYAPGNLQGKFAMGSGMSQPGYPASPLSPGGFGIAEPLRGLHGSANPAPNKTQGAKPNMMSGDESNHPAAQLASYLATQRSGPWSSTRGTDPAMFVRGGNTTMPGVTAGVRG